MNQESRTLRVGLVRPVRQLWPRCAALTLLLGSGCHPHAEARATRSAATSELLGPLDTPQRASAAPAREEAPPPPVPASHPDGHDLEESRLSHPSGTSICAQQRPELADVFLAVDVTNYTAPEQRVLLRTWLAATLAPALGESAREPGAYAAPGCEDRLFCVAFAKDRAEKAIDQLADFFNAASVQTFPAAQAGALDRLDELYQRSSTFRLHALLEALFSGRISAQNATQLPALDASLGAGALLAVAPTIAHQALLAQLPATQVSIFAPHAAQALGQRFFARLRLKASAATRQSPRYVPTAPIRVADERYPDAQLLLTWPTVTPQNAHQAVTALAHLAEHIKTSHPSVLTTLHEGNGITPRPALRVAASYSTLLQLGPEVDAWATQRASAADSLPTTSPPKVPCAAGPALSSVQPGQASTPHWGRPQIIIWGAEHSKPSEEFL